MVGENVVTDEKIGQGQFGKVYISQRREHYFSHFRGHPGYLTACKVINLHGKTRKQIDDMEKEALMMRNLDHPNIIRLHQASRTQNNLYLFTDYCDQGDLKGFMKRVCA
jgi:serine/threonine protein kinase